MVKQLMGASGFTFVLAAVLMKPCITIKWIHEQRASQKRGSLKSFVLADNQCFFVFAC